MKVQSVKHTTPNSSQITRLITNHNKKSWSDHAAVITTLSLSDIPKPKRNDYYIQKHTLKNKITYNKLHHIIFSKHCPLANVDNAIETLDKLLTEVV